MHNSIKCTIHCILYNISQLQAWWYKSVHNQIKCTIQYFIQHDTVTSIVNICTHSSEDTIFYKYKNCKYLYTFQWKYSIIQLQTLQISVHISVKIRNFTVTIIRYSYNIQDEYTSVHDLPARDTKEDETTTLPNYHSVCRNWEADGFYCEADQTLPPKGKTGHIWGEKSVGAATLPAPAPAPAPGVTCTLTNSPSHHLSNYLTCTCTSSTSPAVSTHKDYKLSVPGTSTLHYLETSPLQR